MVNHNFLKVALVFNKFSKTTRFSQTTCGITKPSNGMFSFDFLAFFAVFCILLSAFAHFDWAQFLERCFWGEKITFFDCFSTFCAENAENVQNKSNFCEGNYIFANASYVLGKPS